MKLSEVSTEDLKESLKALADLRRKYEEKRQVTQYAGYANMNRYSCPLCNFGKDGETGASMSCHCPWVWIANHPCVSTGFSRGFSFVNAPIPTRLKRVARWEAKIKAEIEGR